MVTGEKFGKNRPVNVEEKKKESGLKWKGVYHNYKREGVQASAWWAAGKK